MKKLTASLHLPNGDIMETVIAMDYECLEKFMVRMCRRWFEHLTGDNRMVVGSFEPTACAEPGTFGGDT